MTAAINVEDFLTSVCYLATTRQLQLPDSKRTIAEALAGKALNQDDPEAWLLRVRLSDEVHESTRTVAELLLRRAAAEEEEDDPRRR